MFFDSIILKCFSHLNGERSVSSVFHLLKGNKSIQTIQDAHSYQMDKLYGIHRHLTKHSFNQKVSFLLDEGYLKVVEGEKNAVRLSGAGLSALSEYEQKMPFDYFNGLKYNETGDTFQLRLLLLIQTLTNTKMRFYQFIPITDQSSIEQWVKQSYKRIKANEDHALQVIYQEMYKLLEAFPNREASLFVERLTGYKIYGKSLSQLAESNKLPITDVYLLLTGIVHKMIQLIEEEVEQFPMLSSLLGDLTERIPITNSANQTYQLLQKQYTIDQIAIMRNLKVNTIHDHIVEIALYDVSFPLNHYLTKEKQQQIIAVINQESTFKLRDIKKAVQEDISYFEIRLVLAAKKNKSTSARLTTTDCSP